MLDPVDIPQIGWRQAPQYELNHAKQVKPGRTAFGDRSVSITPYRQELKVDPGKQKGRVFYTFDIHPKITLAQSAGAVEYTDCTYVEG